MWRRGIDWRQPPVKGTTSPNLPDREVCRDDYWKCAETKRDPGFDRDVDRGCRRRLIRGSIAWNDRSQPSLKNHVVGSK
jgi:hypothetical protein